MTRIAVNNRMIALAAGTALASMALSACTTQSAPRADVSASDAQQALAKGWTDKAVDHAEAAVLASPRDASYRAMLGAAYMESGRFQSAATSFDDAIKLGDGSARTALSYALAQVAANNPAAAIAMLDERRSDIEAGDLGLALALAGQADRGIHVLGNALRSGHNTPKIRQNLAYAYALRGDWRAARIMAAEDVPADQLNERIGEWARVAQPGQSQARVASLLGVPMVGDSGQPVALALSNHPSAEQLAMEASQAVEPVVPDSYALAPLQGELPAVASAAPDRQFVKPAEAPSEPMPNFATAFTQSAPAPAAPVAQRVTGTSFVSQPVVQTVPAANRAARPSTRSAETAATLAAADTPAADGSDGTHLIQLGSFSSEAGAKRAWTIYAKRYPQLRDHDRVITKAVVRGKTYYRVSAAGFAANSSRSMCSTVKRSGEGCIAWAANRPLPGAVDTGLRMASR